MGKMVETKSPIPAAQYLRMSTGRQECSLYIQREAINRYAERHGFDIVTTYSDEGRSGVNLRKRTELVRLLDDVIVGKALFKAILVYDVSRWGRFQDCDEAAHYEFICKRAGVPIVYCAENFSNENSLSNSVMKALKRTMAAEYSREMGEKVHAGCKRLVERGYKQGGKAGFGFKRLLVSADGEPKRFLSPGELKNLRTDRVLLVPGEIEEVRTVQEIYRQLIEDKKSPREIMHDLNKRNVPNPNGKWSLGLIRRILTDPKYAGYSVWNRSTGRLGANRVSNSKPHWILHPNAIEPVIAPYYYQHAQAALGPYSKPELLAILRLAKEEKGALTRRIIQESPDLPSERTFVKQFGSLRAAFELAGRQYPQPTCQQSENARVRRELLFDELKALFPTEISLNGGEPESMRYLLVDGTETVGVAVCPSSRHPKHTNWYVEPSWVKGTSISLIARLELDGSRIRDFLLFPTRKFRLLRRLTEIGIYRRFVDARTFYSALQQLLLTQSSTRPSSIKEDAHGAV
jgi:DNA invertase Pin-like site-specific DNA recombinase